MASASESVEINSSEGKARLVKTGKAIRKKPCRFCKKEFRYQDLPRHERIHTGEKPFPCDFCSKRFASTSDLATHKRIHTGEMPYKCEQCTKCFRTPSQLANHKRVHSGEKPFCCSLCGKFFRTSATLTDHKKYHSAERPYQCSECPKTFATSTGLSSHKKTHSNQKPFCCRICNKTFRFQYKLKVHEGTHTGELLFKCSLCKKQFNCASYLKKHLKRHKEKECDQNVDPTSSQIESGCISENLSPKDNLKKPLSEPLAYVKCEAGLLMEHDLSSEQSVEYPECMKTSAGQDFDVASLAIKVENGHPAAAESSLQFEFVSTTFVEKSVDGAMGSCRDVLGIKIKEELL